MPNYRRWRVPGGTYFLTFTLLDRGSCLLVDHIDALREAVRLTRRERPFHIDGWGADHVHLLLGSCILVGDVKRTGSRREEL